MKQLTSFSFDIWTIVIRKQHGLLLSCFESSVHKETHHWDLCEPYYLPPKSLPYLSDMLLIWNDYIDLCVAVLYTSWWPCIWRCWKIRIWGYGIWSSSLMKCPEDRFWYLDLLSLLFRCSNLISALFFPSSVLWT